PGRFRMAAGATALEHVRHRQRFRLRNARLKKRPSATVESPIPFGSGVDMALLRIGALEKQLAMT
ncbi:MAG TPA: hypothetical protein PKC98_11255, partial [Candidatus Melainabacteria bacterium]|nr:hypothetical protein [Candidatus Melainabacteria bacterium]